MKEPVGYFKDKSGAIIAVMAKDDEASADAISRVAAEHGVDPSSVTKEKPDNPGDSVTPGPPPDAATAATTPPERKRSRRTIKKKNVSRADPRTGPNAEQKLREKGLLGAFRVTETPVSESLKDNPYSKLLAKDRDGKNRA